MLPFDENVTQFQMTILSLYSINFFDESAKANFRINHFNKINIHIHLNNIT